MMDGWRDAFYFWTDEALFVCLFACVASKGDDRCERWVRVKRDALDEGKFFKSFYIGFSRRYGDDEGAVG